jgi:hypothetical protein
VCILSTEKELSQCPNEAAEPGGAPLTEAPASGSVKVLGFSGQELITIN